MVRRRYADYLPDEPRPAEDQKPVREGPWAGRTWVQQEEGRWHLTLEWDDKVDDAVSDSFDEIARLAVADPRVVQVFAWSPTTRDFVRHTRGGVARPAKP